MASEAERIARGLNWQMAAIVRFLASRNEDRNGALSAREIGETMTVRRLIFRPSSPSEWAGPWLRRMGVWGLVRKLGWAGNARTWTLTDLGRSVAAALRAQENRDEG